MTDIVDHVALERASRGDRGVWKNLTRTERRLAMTAARERRLTELAENAEWRDGEAVPFWFREIVSAAGYGSLETFMNAARRMHREAEQGSCHGSAARPRWAGEA